MRESQLRESPFIKAGRVVSRFHYDDVYVAEMPANLENFSKKRSRSVVVGAILAHIGMNPRHSAGGPSCVAIFAKVSKRLK